VADRPSLPPWPGPPLRVPPGYRPPEDPPLPTSYQRPTYREPHPVRPDAAAIGGIAALAWYIAFVFVGAGSLSASTWWGLLAGAIAWAVALVLVRFGDRGVATGIAIVTAVCWGVTTFAVGLRWVTSGDWPLW